MHTGEASALAALRMASTTVSTRAGGSQQTTTVVVGSSSSTTVVVRNPTGDEEGTPPPPPPSGDRPGFCVPYELKPSGVAGLGIFAAQPIPRGTLIWKYDSAIVKEHDEASLVAALGALPSDAERVELLEHVYGWEGAIHEILDDGKFWNHSTAEHGQNTGDHPDGSPPGDSVSSYALCDIEAGSELLDDYTSYDEIAWFEALCAQYGAASCNTVGKTYR